MVVPRLGGRIASYGPVDGPNLLWFSEADAPTEGWLNHGGEKTWIGPPSTWRKLGGKSWPPPAFFDQAAYTATRQRTSPNAVALVSPPDAASGLRVERLVELLPDGTLSVTSRLLPCGENPPVPIGDLRLWSVCQIPLPERVDATLGSGQTATLTPAGEKELHAFLSPRPLSAHIGKVLVVAETATPDGASADVYFTGTSTPPERRYAELEFNAPATHGLTVRYRCAERQDKN